MLKAVDDNFIDGILLLLSYGTNPLRGSCKGISPMDRVVQKGYVDIVDVLYDATVNGSKSIPNPELQTNL